MYFSLEALQALHGDALLLHWGTTSDPKLMVIDGGPSPTYQQVLRQRLLDLAASRTGTLVIDLLMISHIDDDHINGVEHLLSDLAKGTLAQVRVRSFWFNSFDDLVGVEAGFVSLGVSNEPQVDRIKVVAGSRTRRIIASVPQGNTVAGLASQLGLEGNPPFKGPVAFTAHAARTVPLGPRLNVTVLGPNKQRLKDLRSAWSKTASTGAAADAALAYVDDSVPNLSSIIVLVQSGRRKMLLTGDARGDDVLAGLRTAGLLRRAPFRVDLLKLPHHGSDRNVDTDFFRTVVASHYVVSGNGKYGNPELATLQMLTEARRGEAFSLHLTYREPRVESWLQRNRSRRDKYTVNYRQPKAASIRIDLADPIAT